MGGNENLRAIDAVWLELEHGGPPVAIGSVSRCDGPAPDVEAVRALVRGRLGLMPRLGQVPGADHTWHDVPLDLDAHVDAVHVDGGTRADVDAAVGRIMEQPLDPSRPPWELHVLDSGAGGAADPGGAGAGPSWALVWRMHHSVADGIGALMLAGHVFDTAPGGGPTLGQAVAQAGRRQAEHARDAAAHADGPAALADALGDRLPGPLGRPLGRAVAAGGHAAVGTLHAAGAALAALPHLPGAARTALPGPPSPLTGPLGPRRRWRSADLPLDAVKAVGRAHGATVNDVVVSLVTAGLREALAAQGDPPARGAVARALLPVSLRPPGDDAATNQVSALLGRLPVGLDDPVERLCAVVAHLEDLKRSRGYLVLPALLDVVDRAVPAAVQEVAVSRLGDTVTPWMMDTVATNVPGPQFPLWVLGARVRSMHPVIPVAAHVRTTIGVLSYDGAIHVGVTAAVGGPKDRGGDGRDAGPDVDVVADAMLAELAALR